MTTHSLTTSLTNVNPWLINHLFFIFLFLLLNFVSERNYMVTMFLYNFFYLFWGIFFIGQLGVNKALFHRVLFCFYMPDIFIKKLSR